MQEVKIIDEVDDNNKDYFSGFSIIALNLFLILIYCPNLASYK